MFGTSSTGVERKHTSNSGIGKIAFEIPCDPLAERERQLSGKPQGVSLVTQFFMRVEVPGAADKAAGLVR
jgi:hypothetical protein